MSSGRIASCALRGKAWPHRCTRWSTWEGCKCQRNFDGIQYFKNSTNSRLFAKHRYLKNLKNEYLKNKPLVFENIRLLWRLCIRYEILIISESVFYFLRTYFLRSIVLPRIFFNFYKFYFWSLKNFFSRSASKNQGNDLPLVFQIFCSLQRKKIKCRFFGAFFNFSVKANK